MGEANEKNPFRRSATTTSSGGQERSCSIAGIITANYYCKAVQATIISLDNRSKPYLKITMVEVSLTPSLRQLNLNTLLSLKIMLELKDLVELSVLTELKNLSRAKNSCLAGRFCIERFGCTKRLG